MTGDIFIYGPIGTETGEISFDNVSAQIAQNKEAKELTLHIITPGGDVFEGEAIYNSLLNTGKKITTQIEGTCASIGTLLAAAGSRIVMNKTGRFMIHNPQITGLNQSVDSRGLRKVAAQLDQIKTLLINVWASRPGIKVDKDKLWELYDNETWLTAEEAQEAGFIDETTDAIKAVAKIDFTKFKNNMEKDTVFQNLMKRLTNALSTIKVKNEAREALQDGKIIVVLTEDDDWTGKQVIYEDGTPLPAGDHTLASGKSITVDDTSTITAVKEAEVENKNDMDKDKEIEELKAQLAQAQEASQKANNETASAKAETVKFQNKLTGLEKEFLALKEIAEKTFGDVKPNHKGPVNKAPNNQEAADPMGDMALDFYKGRNLITTEE